MVTLPFHDDLTTLTNWQGKNGVWGNMANINQCPVPNGWSTAYTGMYYGIGGAPNVILDNTVLHNGNPSVRIDPAVGTDPAREANSYSIPIVPGNRLYFKLYIKMSAPASGETDRGGRFGIDFYGPNRITGVQTPDGRAWTVAGGYPSNEGAQFVGWGQDFTLRTMDFIVPAYYEADPWSPYPRGQHVTPTRIIPWLQVASNVNGGKGWFADVELYINPEIAITIDSVPIKTTMSLLEI